ncbi:MAG: cobyrinate a,c-diamide synthase [Thermodesulfovibrionales bacterium]|jgi:cobyrinic acid a,c-diamide synthase
MRGIIIAGTHSGCGKTTVTLGILAALKRKGLTVQAFKTGPDFIDSGLHRLITGRPSRNLDLWMCGESYVRDSFFRNSLDVDVSVIEGVMGLYDGALSTASLADKLDLPIILVVDAYGLAESAGALVHGFAEYNRNKVGHTFSFLGTVFNRVASENHYERLKASIGNMPVLGYLPRDLAFEIPHRHLGLTVAEESPLSDENLHRLSDAVLRHIDVDAILAAENRRDAGTGKRQNREGDGSSLLRVPSPSAIAVAYDRAFCFYYEDNLDLLKQEGAEIVRFSPLHDSMLPDNVDGVYIGGGYPELHARELSQNKSMLRSIHDWADAEKPLYAECGGLMYLSQGIHDFDGTFFPMAGIYPFETQMKKGRSKLGYREIRLTEDCLLGKKGARLRGHEFHYSEIPGSPSSTEVYAVQDGSGREIGFEGYRLKNALASYIHIHFGSNPAVARNVMDFVKENKWTI